jgi:hypothetical protein
MHEESENMNPRDEAETSAGAGRLPSELQSFEAALSQLRPNPAAIDRDRLMFLAGQASVQGKAVAEQRSTLPGWFWPASSAVMTGVAAALLFLLVTAQPWASVAPLRLPGQQPTDGVASSSTPESTATSPDASSLAWRKRITEELLSSDSLAHARAELPEYSPSYVDEEILSSHSYKQLLDEAGDFRRHRQTSHSLKSSG